MTSTSQPTHSQTALVLGARGRFGRAATDAFLTAGWKVRAFVRPGSAADIRAGVTVIEGDGFDADCVAAAAEGADVIIHGLNPPYPAWSRDLPRSTASVLAAAKASGATVMIEPSARVMVSEQHEIDALLAEVESDEADTKPADASVDGGDNPHTTPDVAASDSEATNQADIDALFD